MGAEITAVIPLGRPTVVPRRTVRSEMSFFVPGSARMVCPGRSYEATLNPQSAVAAVLEDGAIFGLKPGEFDFVCPFAAGGETILPVEAGQEAGYPWRIVGYEAEGWTVDGTVYRVHAISVGVCGWKIVLVSR